MVLDLDLEKGELLEPHAYANDPFQTIEGVNCQIQGDLHASQPQIRPPSFTSSYIILYFIHIKIKITLRYVKKTCFIK